MSPKDESREDHLNINHAIALRWCPLEEKERCERDGFTLTFVLGVRTPLMPIEIQPFCRPGWWIYVPMLMVGRKRRRKKDS